MLRVAVLTGLWLPSWPGRRLFSLGKGDPVWTKEPPFLDANVTPVINGVTRECGTRVHTVRYTGRLYRIVHTPSDIPGETIPGYYLLLGYTGLYFFLGYNPGFKPHNRL